MRRLVVFVLVLGGGGWFVYHFLMDREAKDTTNILAAKAGVGEIIPWKNRATSAVHVMLDGQAKATIGHSVRAITHPTGEGGDLAGYDIRPVGDQISVRLQINWKGGFLGGGYSTVVIWEFDEQHHVRAVVTQDTGAFGVAESNKQKLDEYFQTEIYPVLVSNIAG